MSWLNWISDWSGWTSFIEQPACDYTAAVFNPLKLLSGSRRAFCCGCWAGGCNRSKRTKYWHKPLGDLIAHSLPRPICLWERERRGVALVIVSLKQTLQVSLESRWVPRRTPAAASREVHNFPHRLSPRRSRPHRNFANLYCTARGSVV